MYKTLDELRNNINIKKIPEYTAVQDIKQNTPEHTHSHIQHRHKQNTPEHTHSNIQHRHNQNKTPTYKKKETGKKLWGPPLWFSLHFGALNLPEKLTPDDQSMVVNFLKSLPIWIPCDECKNHAYKYIQQNTYRLMSMSKTKQGVFQFLWEFHNHVNRETGKREISLEEAYYIYTQHPETSFK